MIINRIKSNNLIINNNDIKNRFISNILYGGAFLCLCYVFLLGNTVWNIIERKKIESDILAIRTEVNTLELKHLELSSKIDINLAHDLGFSETKNKKFATRKSSLGSLAIATNEL